MSRSVISIDDLDNDEIDSIFQLADRLLDEMATPGKPYRVRGRRGVARDFTRHFVLRTQHADAVVV